MIKVLLILTLFIGQAAVPPTPPVSPLNPYQSFQPKPQISDEEINGTQCFTAEGGWVFINPIDSTISFSKESCGQAMQDNSRIIRRVNFEYVQI
jgi:hypothetical protein